MYLVLDTPELSTVKYVDTIKFCGTQIAEDFARVAEMARYGQENPSTVVQYASRTSD